MITNWKCKLFGHLWDKINPYDHSYHCKRCETWFRGILPRGYFYKDYALLVKKEKK